MASSYLRTPPSSPPLATLSRVRSFGTLGRASRTGCGSGVTKEEVAPPPPSVSVSGSLSSLRTQLDLLDQLAGSTSDLEGYESESNPDGPTIREQLAHLVFQHPSGKESEEGESEVPHRLAEEEHQ